MRLLSPKTIRNFVGKHKDADPSLRAWASEVKKARWKNFNQLKKQFSSASVVGNDRVVFNIKGNTYRIVVRIDFEWQMVFIRFIGTHAEYDKIDVTSI